MAQNSIVIGNLSAPEVRADINEAFQSLVSLYSGDAEPSPKYANMLWYDTSANILKMNSEADDAWISIGYLDQTANAFRILDDTQVVNTSGSQTGLIGDQSTATWETGTATTESLVSPAKVKAAIETLSIPHVASVATTSGTSHDLTGIPAGVNQIDVFLDGVSQTDNTANGDLLIQLGTSGGLVTSGYSSLTSNYAVTRSSTAGFIVINPGSAATTNGVYRLRRLADGSHSWIMSGEGRYGATSGVIDCWSNAIDIGATLTQVRLTTVGGTPTFDAGGVSIRCYY